MATFVVVGVLLTVLQALAAVPWLLALDRRLLGRVREASFWGIGLLACAAIGLVWGLFLHANSDAGVLTNWGRWYTSFLHLQLGADLFVGVFYLMLVVWPKGGAVALSAFREEVRQPKFWFLGGAAALLMAISPFIPYFTFGEDLKMVKELCYAFTMLAAAFFGVVAASMSVHEEIEGRTAITLMSKPVSRRQFLLGKYGGILLAAMAMTVLLGWWLVWVVHFKAHYEEALFMHPLDRPQDPAWVNDLVDSWLEGNEPASLLKGIGYWVNAVGMALPGLVIGFCQVMVLLAISVALATRLPMVINIVVCLGVYFLGHLTPIMTEVSQNQYALVYFVAQLFETLLPGLDLFDVGTAIVREVHLPMGEYALYSLQVTFYAVVYTTIALLFGLILFEDRDLA